MVSSFQLKHSSGSKFKKKEQSHDALSWFVRRTFYFSVILLWRGRFVFYSSMTRLDSSQTPVVLPAKKIYQRSKATQNLDFTTVLPVSLNANSHPREG